MEVERVWTHGNRLIFKFKGVDSISEAERLAGAEVSIPFEERAEAPQGEYFESDLLGCEAVDRSGRILGIVQSFQQTGGVPLLALITKEGKELLIPFAKSMLASIDVDRKRIEVDLPEGLEDLN